MSTNNKIIELFGRVSGFNRTGLVLNALIVACTTVTSVAMFSGFLALGQSTGPLEVVASALFTVLIAAALTYTVHGIFSVASSSERLLWIVLWLTCATASITLSYGMYYGLLSADTYSEEQVRTEANTIVEPLAGFAAAYGQLAAGATEASRYSAEIEKVEFNNGGTCPGSTRPEDGPRRRLRAADAALFKSYAEHFDAQRKSMMIAVAGARAAAASYSPARHLQTMNTIRDAHAAASRAAGDPRIADWAATLKQRTAAGRAPMTDPATGTSFVCPDGQLEAKISGAARVMLPKLPQFTEIEVPSHQQGVRRGVQLLTGKVAFDARIDGLPLLLGILVDLLLVGFVRVKSTLADPRGPDRKGFFPGRNPPGAPSSGAAAVFAMHRTMSTISVLGVTGSHLDSALREDVWAWLTLLQRWSARGWKSMRVAVPDDPESHAEARDLRLVVSMLGLKRHSTQTVRRMPRGRLSQVCAAKLAPGVTVDLYTAPASLLDELERDWLRESLAQFRTRTDPGTSFDRPIAA